MIIADQFDLSQHAEEKRLLLCIKLDWVVKTLTHPDRVHSARGQQIYSRRVDRGRRVLKVVVDDFQSPNVIVTMYFDEF